MLNRYMLKRVRLIELVFFICVSIFFSACKSGEKDTAETKSKYPRFISYASFSDKPELHMDAATRKGVGPLKERGDTLKYEDKLVKMPPELDMYKMAELTHSVPMLVDDASRLLLQIGMNFRDSLRSKKLPAYKVVVTSVTRSQADVKSLSKRNINSSENSVHCYGTTFDVSWKRFEKIGPKGDDDVSPDRLKYVLGEVIHDLRMREKCYVVHEKKQACFHITVR